MKGYYQIFAVAAAILFAAACEKSDVNGGDEGNGSTDVRDAFINGTAIVENVNAAGMIIDASTGKGIAGVPVSDGYTHTVTDENGVYQMQANRYCRNIYYSLPSGYKTALDEEYNQPLFYSTKTFNYKGYNRNDFKLEPEAAGSSDNFTLIAIGDPQCQNSSHVSRYTNETIADIKQFIGTGDWPNPVAVTLGDIVYDSPEMWGGMKESMADMRVNGSYIPVYQVIGNHDHDAKESSQYNAIKNYVSWFGPTDYSFNIGKVHFVCLDNVQCKSTGGSSWSYDAGLSAAQMKWLEEDLAFVENKEDKMIILNVHIPFRNGQTSGGGSMNLDKYHEQVLKLLVQFKEAHIMAGHRHFPQNWIHDDYVCKGGLPIYEHIHGAACGAFWLCNSNLTGSPNGYSVYTVSGNTMKDWVAKATGRDVSFQMRVYNGNDIYTGDKGYEYTWYSGGRGPNSNSVAKGYSPLQGCFVAAVWNSDDTHWKVELYRDGTKVGDMQRVPDGSCSNPCSTSYFYNQLNRTGGDYKIYESSHYWYYKPTGISPELMSGWEVRATQTIPGSGITHVYTSNIFQTDFTGL